MQKTKQKRTTIFKQLILNILLPVVIVLLLLAVFNYWDSKQNFEKWNKEKSEIIIDEITHIHKFQDLALGILEVSIDKRLRIFSNTLINNYFNNPTIIQKLNLDSIRKVIGMDSDMEDIYFISRGGYIVNTTFLKDKNLNMFAFGKEHENYLINVFNGGKFISERITIESTTKRLKKYSYQPTNDGSYIIELGAYSKKADEIVAFIRNRLEELPKMQESIVDVDVFIGSEKPFSLYKKKTIIKHPDIVQSVFKNEGNQSISENINGKRIYYEYIYMHRQNSDLYEGSVIQITSDRTAEAQLLRNELFKFLMIFGITILIVLLLIYNKTKSITKPIKNLVENVIRISKGSLDERAEVVGKNEITTLTEQFNLMISQLESYTNELEEKVKERTAEIVKQKEIVEKQNENITGSIRYAQKIQNAVLPTKTSFENMFTEYFIFFKPRDIVSGDFYFLQKINKHILVAAVDCTGHGVPGAFMSMLGIAFLNEIVRRREITQASQVLNILRQQIKTSLKQTGKKRESKDGMDIAICAINTETFELQFAGAYNPLYLIRNNELTIYKGDRMPIGIYRKEKETFTNHIITLERGDKIYLFSDGFVDQINGETKEKFMSNNFKNLITEISALPMIQQKDKLEETFNNWKGNSKQIDDVVIIGVEVN